MRTDRTVERVRQWHRRNDQKRRTFREGEEDLTLSGHLERIIGCFAVMPVNQRPPSASLVNGIKGTEFAAENIASPEERPAALYIGVLAAIGNGAYALLALLGHIRAKRGSTGVPIYARPIRKDGEALLKSYNFTPVVPEFSRAAADDICSTKKV